MGDKWVGADGEELEVEVEEEEEIDLEYDRHVDTGVRNEGPRADECRLVAMLMPCSLARPWHPNPKPRAWNPDPETRNPDALLVCLAIAATTRSRNSPRPLASTIMIST